MTDTPTPDVCVGDDVKLLDRLDEARRMNTRLRAEVESYKAQVGSLKSERDELNRLLGTEVDRHIETRAEIVRLLDLLREVCDGQEIQFEGVPHYLMSIEAGDAIAAEIKSADAASGGGG